jgi:asparagine synthase (glutamine-hydrolysing)
MCGIAGVLNLNSAKPIEIEALQQMILAIRHRGPDEFGIYRDDSVGLANARLSIVDLSGGQQPISNEDGTLWIVFNGEIFNYVELRPHLEARGHRFTTHCDTEVIVHLYEEYGPACLNYLNGQFAIALWNSRDRSLFLARDRMGIRPVFYTIQEGRLIFGSEIKSILSQPEARAEIDLEALKQTFTFWSPQSPRSIFRDIVEVPAGHYLIAKEGQAVVQRYWSLDFAEDVQPRSEEDYLGEFEHLLIDATQIRLRADVPVGAYLSGGLDSSVIAAIIRKTDTYLDTFSISFPDPHYDESSHQRRMAQFLGTHHQELFCDYADIARVFPDVIWHTEAPILRTAPAPMFLLSGLVHEHRYKVVLTGEGADEVLAGYDIFKEMRVRRFWARQPESQLRPLLLKKLYPDISRLFQSETFLKAFFGKGLDKTGSPFFSHEIRWTNTARATRFLAQSASSANGHDYPITLPAQFAQWSHLAQAQYLEMATFLSPYLLSSQGDRVAMAHSVEGRYPFLDYRVVEFCNRLPASLKQKGLTEKWLLRQLARKLIPSEIWQRNKRPYRAPIQRTFFASGTVLEYVSDMLSSSAITRTGYFNPDAVEKLVKKASGEARLSEVDEMALVGILSTQLLDQLFVRRARPTATENLSDRLKVVDATSLIV